MSSGYVLVLDGFGTLRYSTWRRPPLGFDTSLGFGTLRFASLLNLKLLLNQRYGLLDQRLKPSFFKLIHMGVFTPLPQSPNT